MGERIINFSAGPAVLPESVLKQAQHDLWDLFDTGIGILEHSHRGKAFDRVIAEAETDCRAVGSIGDNYRVLFLQGGASTQFFMVPANLLPQGATADYLVTGAWAKKAAEEAGLYGTAHIAASSEDENFSYIPSRAQTTHSPTPVYVHYASNNTIFGTQFQQTPTAPEGAFLVCDASSDIYSRPIDVSAHGLIYAGAQKNLGPSGVALVIVREDLIEKPARALPTMLRYGTHAEKGSRYNTPPTFGIYMMGLIFKWIIEQGGIAGVQQHNEDKAGVIYSVIDGSSFYRGAARGDSRSMMNITFNLPTPELEAAFITKALDQGMSGLKGHRSVGGVRASVYNAFPRAGCETLAQFMVEFERTKG